MTPGPIAIIGASLAGLNAAVELRRRGFAGRLAIFGEEPDRPYDRPPLSKEMLRGEWPESEIALRFDEAELGADWRLGERVVGLNAEALALRLEDGSTESFAGGIVIATGAAPRLLPGASLRGVHVLRSIEDMRALREDLARRPARVAVIGGGFIGQEVAASCRALDLAVTMIEAAAPAQHVVGHEVAIRLADWHRSKGADVRLGISVAALEGEGRLQAVHMSDGSIVEADVAVVGIGVKPNIGWLEESGLTIDNGVVCDETCLAAPAIVAAGDVACWPNQRYGEMRRVEHWDNAVRQAVHAARRLLASPGEADYSAPYRPVPWFWSDQYGSKLQLVGSPINHEEVQIVADEARPDRFLALYRKGEALTAVFGINSAKRILGFRRDLEGGLSWEQGLAVLGVAHGIAA